MRYRNRQRLGYWQSEAVMVMFIAVQIAQSDSAAVIILQ